jgi:alpha-L-fucosidase
MQHHPLLLSLGTLLIALLLNGSAAAQPNDDSRLDWFNEARYGLFIHWGPYSVAARGEWVMNRERIPLNEYRTKYAENFKAEKYDPAAWMKLAKQAGMKYVVLTARHHDGYCLWDTQTTDFNAVKVGPGRDLIRPYVEAAREAGIKVGIYLSYADWAHPDYPGAYHRGFPRKWPEGTQAAQARFHDHVTAQLRELMTDYGKIDILWWDGVYPRPADGGGLNQLARELQPDILINDRNGKPFDFKTSEQSVGSGGDVAIESCLTLNDHAWGYHAGERWKTPHEVLSLLLKATAGGGNLLLNVAPRADGTIPVEARNILTTTGAWLARNREFLSNSDRSTFSWNNWGTITTKGSRIYLHMLYSPGAELCVADFRNPVRSARYLDSGENVPFEQEGDRLFLRGLPVPLADPLATTIVLEVEGTPEPIQP